MKLPTFGVRRIAADNSGVVTVDYVAMSAVVIICGIATVYGIMGGSGISAVMDAYYDQTAAAANEIDGLAENPPVIPGASGDL